MDRRQFLAVGGLAAVTPVLAKTGGTLARSGASPGLFKQINFRSDGLGLDPREYAAVLRDVTLTKTLEADAYSNGGFIAELEQKFAQLLGKDAAMFVPTGTLANHLAIRKLAGDDRRVLLQAESHFYNDSGDCAETLSGLNLIPLAPGGSTIELAEVQRWVERSAGGRVETKVGVISIESPVRRMDHQMVEFAELERVSRYAHEQGIRLHLDGARMFNLPLHSGKSVREVAALFDSVYVSLSKHFNGAAGAILAGDAKFIDDLFHMRRMFGGSMPQAWPQVAVVPQYADRYQDDYAKAWASAEQFIALLHADGRFKASRVADGTSRFFLTAAGIAPDVLSARVLKRGVILSSGHPDTGTFPMQVNPTLLRTTPSALARIFIDAVKS